MFISNQLTRTSLMISAALSIGALTACGGGGGGGSSSAGVAPTNELQAYSQAFNPYLPLNNGSTATYSNTLVNGSVSSVQELVDTATNKYKISFGNSSSPLSLYFTSSPDSIQLYRVDVSAAVSYQGLTTSTQYIRFDNPIVLDEDVAELENQQLGAKAKVVGWPLEIGGIDINYSLLRSYPSYDGSYGAEQAGQSAQSAPALRYKLSLGVTGSGSVNVREQIDLYLFFVKGIGLVKLWGDFDYADLQVTSELESLQTQPQTIWFEHNSGNPSLATGSSATFQTAAGVIDSSDFFIANADEVNALGWISVFESNNGSFEVALQPTENLPDSDDALKGLTSVEVVFQSRSDAADRRSGSVILLGAD